MSGERFLTVTPMLRTSSGRRGSATAIRFWTRTCAVSMLVPTSKVTVMVAEPSALHWLCMYIMFSTPLISCSRGAIAVSMRISGDAPG